MSVFIIVAGLLLAGALFAVAAPLVRRGKGRAPVMNPDSAALSLGVLREQLADLEREHLAGNLDAATYAHERAEVERRALEDGQHTAAGRQDEPRRPLLAVLLSVALLALAVSLYLVLGSPQALTGARPAAPGGEPGAHAMGPQQIQAMVERLSERLQENPADGPGWLMLARSYGVLGRYPESAAAYGRAVGLLPPDAQTLADFADTVAMAQGRRLQGEPEKIVRQALEVDPRNVKALALAGTIAFERQDYPAAVAEWRKILAVVPEESNVASSIQASIADAEKRLGGRGTPAQAEKAAVASVSGVATLDPSLRGKLPPGTAVFIFARAVDGTRVPLAMLRKTVGDLPISFTLDDSMAMAPSFRLSQHEKVVIGARVSKSGDAMPRSGDFEGLSEPVTPGARNVKISIGKEVK